MTRPQLSGAEGEIVRPPEGHSTAITHWPQTTPKKVGLFSLHNPVFKITSFDRNTRGPKKLMMIAIKLAILRSSRG